MRIGVNGRLLISDKMEGIARFIYETTTQMALSHPEDDFIVFFDRKVDPAFNFPSNVKKVVVPWHARHSVLWYLWFEIMLPIFFKKFKIDVFYSGEGYLSKKSRVPTLMVLHDLAYLHYPEHVQKDSLLYYRKNTPKFLEIARSIVTVSEYVKGDIIRNFKMDSNNIKVAYNAISSDKIKLNEHLTTLPDPYFIYVGAIHPRKNIKNLIEGFLKFKLKNPCKTKLVLIGRMAWDTDEVKNIIHQNEDVIYLGMLSEPDKNTWIKNALCLTYISVFEGFGIPLLEAMSLGVPVMTSNVTSMPEVVGDAALCVDPLSIEEISDGLFRIYKEDALRDRLIQQGYKRLDYFSWEKSSTLIYDELNRIKT